MSNLKTFRVSAAEFDQAEVTLLVDLDVLTPDRASEINQFDGRVGALRLDEEHGDVVNTVVRLFGSLAIAYFQGDGGADIQAQTQTDSEFWTQTVLDKQREGWPGCQDLGILIKSVMINAATFFETKLESLA